MSWVSTFTFAILIGIAGSSAWAAQWADACRGHGQKGQAECKAAQAELAAKDAARSAARGGQNVNINAQRLAADAAAQKADALAAKAKCEAAQKKCESQCDQEKGKAQPHASNPQDPLQKPAQQDISSLIDKAKSSDCTKPIEAQKKLLDKAANNLGNDQNAANNTDNASNSGGQPPQIPPIQPPQGGDKKDDQKQALNCDGEEGARYSDCNAKFLAKCMNSMGESGCETFAGRYCGNASGGNSVNLSTGENQHFKTKSANYVVDKSGEGLGSGFCKMVTAYRFCQSVGRSECPSCRGQYAYSSAACQADPTKCVPNMSAGSLADAKNKCPTDPIFLDPTVAKAVENGEGTGSSSGSGDGKSNPVINPDKTAGTPTAGYGTGGGGLGGAGGTGPVGAEGALNGATPESLPIGDANPVSAGGASSGGSIGLNLEDEDEEKRDPAAAHAGGILPAAAVEGLPARDVSNQYGPNLFSISSQVYRNMCAAEKFSTCANKK